MAQKTCVVCGKSFDARGKAKTCSVECSKILKKEYNRKYTNAYFKRRYQEDPLFHEKINAKYTKRRRTDSEFRERERERDRERWPRRKKE